MAETEAERIEREKREKDQQQNTLSSMLDWLNPFSGGGGFSFGGIFQMLLVAVAGYFIARSDSVQEWIGGMMDEDGKPGSGKDKLKGWVDGIGAWVADKAPWLAKLLHMEDAAGKYLESRTDEQLSDLMNDKLPAPAIELIVKNRKLFFDTVKEANGGKISGSDDITNDKSIFALITKQPEFTKKLLAATQIGGSSSGTSSKDFMTAMKAIISDDRLDILLSNEHRANTIEMMLQMGGKEKGLTAAVLEKQFTADLAKNGGKASAGLRELLTSMVEDAPQPLSQEATAIATDLTYETMATQIGTKNRPALDQLKATLGKEGFDNLIATFASGDKGAISMTCLQSKNIGAINAFAKSMDIASLPDDFKGPLGTMAGITMGSPYQKALSTVADKNINPADISTAFAQKDAKGNPIAPTTTQFITSILKPNVLQLIADAGVDNVATIMANSPGADPKLKAVITPQNLQTICQFAVNVHNIEMPTANGQMGMQGVATVTGALMELAVNQNGQPMQKNAALIAGAFKGNQFSSAFKTMIDGLQIDGKQALITAMRNEWGTREDGLLEILASAADVKRLPDVVKNGTAALSLTEMSGLAWLPGQTKIGENIGHLIALDVKEGAAVAPTNTGVQTANAAAGIFH